MILMTQNILSAVVEGETVRRTPSQRLAGCEEGSRGDCTATGSCDAKKGAQQW